MIYFTFNYDKGLSYVQNYQIAELSYSRFLQQNKNLKKNAAHIALTKTAIQNDFMILRDKNWFFTCKSKLILYY